MIDADDVNSAADHLDRAKNLLELVAQQYDDQYIETELGEASDHLDNALERIGEEGVDDLEMPIPYMSPDE